MAEYGRELYTAPFIWINKDKCNIKQDDTTKKYKCNDKFIVEKITIQDKKIMQLSIGNITTMERVFVMDKIGGNK